MAVKASIFFSSSLTRFSVFFCRFRTGGVTVHFRFAFAHRLQGRNEISFSNTQRTLSWRQASQARGRFNSARGSFVSWSSYDTPLDISSRIPPIDAATSTPPSWVSFGGVDSEHRDCSLAKSGVDCSLFPGPWFLVVVINEWHMMLMLGAKNNTGLPKSYAFLCWKTRNCFFS